MPYQSKILLHCKDGVPLELEELVEAFIRDGVKYVGVVGKGASRTEDSIDELVVGDGRDDTRYILTSSHEAETLEQALAFARSLSGEYAGDVQLVEA